MGALMMQDLFPVDLSSKSTSTFDIEVEDAKRALKVYTISQLTQSSYRIVVK